MIDRVAWFAGFTAGVLVCAVVSAALGVPPPAVSVTLLAVAAMVAHFTERASRGRS